MDVFGVKYKRNLQKHNKIQTIVWVASELILGPKHKPIERTAIYEPTTGDLLTDPEEIMKATLNYIKKSTDQKCTTTRTLRGSNPKGLTYIT